MKYLFLITALFINFYAFSQNEKKPEFVTVEANYVGNSNTVFYFKDNTSGNMLTFKKGKKETLEFLESNASDYVGENLTITYKITYVESKRETTANDSLDAVSSTYKKVLSLEDIEESIED